MFFRVSLIKGDVLFLLQDVI